MVGVLCDAQVLEEVEEEVEMAGEKLRKCAWWCLCLTCLRVFHLFLLPPRLLAVAWDLVVLPRLVRLRLTRVCPRCAPRVQTRRWWGWRFDA